MGKYDQNKSYFSNTHSPSPITTLPRKKTIRPGITHPIIKHPTSFNNPKYYKNFFFRQSFTKQISIMFVSLSSIICKS